VDGGLPSPQHERLESERQILGRGKICLSPNDLKISKMPQGVDFGKYYTPFFVSNTAIKNGQHFIDTRFLSFISMLL